MRWLWIAIGGGAVVLAVWGLSFKFGPTGSGARMPPATSPADVRQQEILEQNVGRPGDPDLNEMYQQINGRHFAGALTQIVVRWEPALADVGALAAQAFTLQGMFGRIGTHRLILLNPSLKADQPALARALCHEMVHAYLDSAGDTSTTHGPAFQAVLHRLSAEGAFEGVAADDTEKASLRAWLDAESARLDAERGAIDTIGAEITSDRVELDRAVAALNARISTANAAGGGGPSATEIEELKTRRERFDQRVGDINARIERVDEGRAYFNREVARYNLMMAYPDGLDEESLVPSKPAPGAGGR